MERSYNDRADSATDFDPELQFDKDIDEASISKERLELAGRIDQIISEGLMPVLTVADFRSISGALRASAVAEPVACQADHCPWFEMIWDWLGSEDRYGARNMISDFPDGATTDDLRRMLDEHESEIVAQIKPSHPAPAALVPASVRETARRVFVAGYWLWFGPANHEELAAGTADIEKGWAEYAAEHLASLTEPAAAPTRRNVIK